SESYSSECIRRITQNVSIGCLEIELSDSNEFNCDVYNLIKEFDHEELDIGCEGNEILKEIMVDSFFFDLTRCCKNLDMYECEKITPQALHQVYKSMIEGSTKFRLLFVSTMSPEKCIAFLNLIGINYKDGKFYSNGDIEAYKLTLLGDTLFEYSIFD
ncbi:hypothetical protein PENTCL1PPCAC_28975, partial [Pristionchus entomophagus]